MKKPKILLIITGSIAAYKALELTRLLAKDNFEVNCLMSKGACQFIQPLSFAALSNNEVASDMHDENSNDSIKHIELTRQADLVVVAPASADIIAKIAHGLADDLASSTLLACNKNIIVAPAMNQEMWNNKATQRNLKQINADGIEIIEPLIDKLACHEIGMGKMAEPTDIFAIIKQNFKK